MYVALQDEQRELYKSHGLDTSDLKCSGFGRDGSGIKMGMWAGASMDPCARTLVSPQVRYNSEHYATNILRWGGSFTEGENPWGCPFVWLDESGRRFTDETFLGVFGQLMRAERMKPGRYYAIFDSQYADLISKMPPEHFGIPVVHSIISFVVCRLVIRTVSTSMVYSRAGWIVVPKVPKCRRARPSVHGLPTRWKSCSSTWA